MHPMSRSLRGLAFAVALAGAADSAFAQAPGTVLGFAVDGQSGVDGLADARAIAMSPDGAHLYVAAPTDNAVSVFAVAPNGALGFVEVEMDEVGGVSGLGFATDVAVSPDGAHVYAAGALDDTIAIFARDAGTGALTFVGAVADGGAGGPALDNPAGVVVSPDGGHVFAVALVDDSVVSFARDAGTGALTFVEAEVDDETRALQGPTDLALSPDGAQLYVVNFAEGGDSLLTFAVDAETGALDLIDSEVQNVGGVDGLTGASAVVVSPDGRHVYATGSLSDTISTFERSAIDGSTTYVSTLTDGVAGVDGLNGPAGVTITPDGGYVLVAAANDGGIGIFARDRATGALAYGGIVRDGESAETLGGTTDVVVAPNSRFVAATAAGDDALTVFAPEPGGVALGAATCAALAFLRRRARAARS